MNKRMYALVALSCVFVLGACSINTGKPKATVTPAVKIATQAPDTTEVAPDANAPTTDATAAPTVENGVAPTTELTPTEALTATDTTTAVEVTATVELTPATTTTVTVETGAISVQQTDVKSVVMRATLKVRSGPGLDYKVVGYYRARRTVEVNGVSTDAKWYRVLCVNGEVGDCWVTADTRYVTARR